MIRAVIEVVMGLALLATSTAQAEWKAGPMNKDTYGWGGVVPHGKDIGEGFYFADFQGDHVALFDAKKTRLEAWEIKWYDNSLTLPPQPIAVASGTEPQRANQTHDCFCVTYHGVCKCSDCRCNHAPTMDDDDGVMRLVGLFGRRGCSGGSCSGGSCSSGQCNTQATASQAVDTNPPDMDAWTIRGITYGRVGGRYVFLDRRDGSWRYYTGPQRACNGGTCMVICE